MKFLIAASVIFTATNFSSCANSPYKSGAAKSEATTAVAKEADKKCGESKCGEKKAKHKCGEGKCRDKKAGKKCDSKKCKNKKCKGKKSDDEKCGDKKAEKEGKCGEGKCGGDKKAAKDLASQWLKEHKANLKAMSEGAKMPAGLTGALFGRMVTSDPRANIEAPVHVAHAFTVHAEEAESDYFIAADDLAREEDTGADTIQETELTSGLFYGYVVVDLPGLNENLGGNVALAGEVLHNLTYLIAEVSPGAKLGSTAPYSRASFMLLEAGDRQPRSLAEAFRSPCKAETGQAVAALCDHLSALDSAYATGETRRVMSLANTEVPDAERGSLEDLAQFAKSLPKRLKAPEAA